MRFWNAAIATGMTERHSGRFMQERLSLEEYVDGLGAGELMLDPGGPKSDGIGQTRCRHPACGVQLTQRPLWMYNTVYPVALAVLCEANPGPKFGVQGLPREGLIPKLLPAADIPLKV